jgi:excisionase family DNA binding protein
VTVLQEGKPAARGRVVKDENMANAGKNDNGTFLTVAEVADLMRVSKMTVYRLVHSGELPAVRVGRSFRVHEQAVEEYLGASVYDAGRNDQVG